MKTYRILLLLLSPFILVHLAWRALQCREWRYLKQRAGFGFDAVPPGCDWFHCASVGEVKSVLPLLEELHRRAPGRQFLVTSNTATSRQVVLRYDRPWLHHVYCPIDWKRSVNAFLESTGPGRCVIFETELWPNLVTACCARGIDVCIVNGRLSDRTMRRAGLLSHLYRAAFDCIGHIYARNAEDRRRFIELGADADTTFDAGDIKLISARPDNGRRQQSTQREYVLVVSTHDDEEFNIAKHCAALLRDTLFVIAPRHPERGAAVAGRLQELDLDVALYSRRDEITGDTRVYVLDTIGVLDEWYPGASCVVMGGSFADIGGHNIIEPMAYGKAVCHGPSMHNFVEMHALVQQHRAAVQVGDYAALGELLQAWRDDPRARESVERRAAELSGSLSAVLGEYADRLHREG